MNAPDNAQKEPPGTYSLRAGGAGAEPASPADGKSPLLWLRILIIAATTAIVVITIFLGWRDYIEIKKAATEQFNRQQLHLTRSAAKGIESYFKELTGELKALSEFSCIRRMDPDCAEYLQHAYKGFPPRTSIRLLDKDGVLRFIYPSDGWRGEIIERNYSETTTFRETSRTGRVSVHAVTNEQGHKRIRIAVAVYSTPQTDTPEPSGGKEAESRVFRGVLIGSLDPNMIAQNLVNPIVSGKTGYAWLMDDKGVFLAHFEKEFVGQNAFKVRDKKKPDISFDAVEQIQRKMLSGEEGTGRYVSGRHREKTGAIEKQAAYTPIRVNDKAWSVAVCVPVSEVEEIVGMSKRSELFTLGFVILMLTSCGVLLLAISGRWSHSLERQVRSRTSELRKTSDYLTRLIRYANVPIIVWDPDGKITIFNKAFEEMSGRSEAEMLRQPLEVLFSTESRDESLRKIENAAKGQYWENVEIPLLRSNGLVRVALWNSANIYTEDDTLIATIAQGQDITERTRAENLQHIQHDLAIELSMTSDLTEALDRLLEATFKINGIDCGGVYMVNESTGGLDLVSSKGLPPRFVESASHFEADSSQVRRIMEGKLIYGIHPKLFPEANNVRKHEALHAFAVIPIRYEDKVIAVVNLASHTHDEITPGARDTLEAIAAQIGGIIVRVKAENALRESEERFRAIFETAHDSIFIKDRELKYVQVNPAMGRLFGLPASEIIGKSDADLFGKEAESHITEVDSRVLAGEIIEENHTKPVRGAPRTFHVVKVPMRDRSGGIIGLCGIARDITERKRAEAEKSELQDQLRQASKMEAIGRLAGGIAHDFNNMLAIIQGYADMLLKSISESDKSHGDVESIRAAAKRAAALTKHLLAFGRKQTIQPQVLDLNKIVADADSMLRRIIGEDIELVTTPGDDLWHVKADPTQIEEIIVNLSVNAREAMPDGGKLTVSTTNVDLDEEYAQRHADVNPGEHVLLSISDTGVGMTNEVMDHIFEPFFTTKEMDKGTGLGLSTTYGIVKQSGGHIRVRSTPGEGTTFKIYLPRDAEPVKTAARRHEQTGISGGTETVLVVEDEPAVRDLTCRILREQGYKVLEAGSGTDALHIAADHAGKDIHLLVSDVVMPQMSGRELSDRIKALYPNIKTLFISGYAEDAIAHHGIVADGVHLLGKPFSSRQLTKTARGILDTHQQ